MPQSTWGESCSKIFCFGWANVAQKFFNFEINNFWQLINVFLHCVFTVHVFIIKKWMDPHTLMQKSRHFLPPGWRRRSYWVQFHSLFFQKCHQHSHSAIPISGLHVLRLNHCFFFRNKNILHFLCYCSSTKQLWQNDGWVAQCGTDII